MRTTAAVSFMIPILGSIASPVPATTTVKSAEVAARACAPLTSPTAPYTLVVDRPSSVIQYYPIQAGPNFQLVVGGAPNISPCGVQDQRFCGDGTTTAFTGSGDLWVSVPGGQKVYLASDGHFGFTQPFDDTIPHGALLDPFNVYWKEDQCNSNTATVTTNSLGADTLYACPSMKNIFDPAIQWLLYANVPGMQPPTGDANDCLAFQALASDYNPVGYQAAAYSYE